MLSSLLAMAAFALTGAITPGPVNVLALQHGSQSTKATALLYVLGASLSYAAIVWLMGQGGQWLLERPVLVQWAPRICAAYLLWLAWQLAHAPVAALSPPTPALSPGPSPVPTSSAAAGPAFLQGIAVQSLNPKAWLVALSGVGMFVVPMASERLSIQASMLLFCAVSLGACLLGVGSWAALGRLLSQWLSPPGRQRRLHRVLAGVLVLSVIHMLA